MIFFEVMEDGRYHTVSDKYMIMQVDTGSLYEDAIDVCKFEYVETDICLPDQDIRDEDAMDELVSIIKNGGI